MRGWNPVKTPHACVDRMYFSPSDNGDDFISNPLDFQSPSNDFRTLFCQLQSILHLDKIRGMQEVNVQGMTFDPLAAIHQPAELLHAVAYGHIQSLFHGLNGAHLICDGTNSADPGRDVRCLRIGTAPQEGLKEAGGFEDLQLHIVNDL